MKKTVLNLFAILSFGFISAQDYKTGIGLRAGFPSGVTFKHFIQDDAALEAIVGRSWGYRGFSVTGLYEKHKQAFEVEGLYWLYGAGAHIGFYDHYYYYYRNNKNKYYGSYYNRTLLTIGIDGIFGMEYKIKEIPFTIGLDIKPTLDFVPFGYLDIDAGLSFRYVF